MLLKKASDPHGVNLNVCRRLIEGKETHWHPQNVMLTSGCMDLEKKS